MGQERCSHCSGVSNSTLVFAVSQVGKSLNTYISMTAIVPLLPFSSRHGDGNWCMLALVVLTEAHRLANS